MAKTFHDNVLDGALNIIKNNTTGIYFCSAQPTNYTEAISTYALMNKTSLTSSNFTGPADNGGTGGGRKLTVNSMYPMTPTANGTITYVALVGTSGSTLYAVTTVTSQAVTTSQTWSSPTFDIIVKDPT